MGAVLFLGAGFSAPYGQPTMNQFMGYAASNLNEKDQKFLGMLALEAARANRMLDSSPTNLEDILSFAVMGDRLRLYGPDGEERSPRLRRILQEVYSAYRQEAERNYWARFDAFKGFLATFDLSVKRGLDGIITTNYDLNVEATLSAHGTIAALPFEYERFPDKFGWELDQSHFLCCGPLKEGHTRALPEVPLFKLHGSVSWFEGESSESLPLVADASVLLNRKPGQTSVPVISLRSSDLDLSGYDPLIVPPTFLKPDVPPPLARTWEGAAHALKHADRLIFVGYSFPPTDVEMKYFLASSLSDNVALQAIHIIDPYAEEIVGRLQRDDSGFGSHFKHLLDPMEFDSWIRLSGTAYSIRRPTTRVSGSYRG